MKSLTEMQVTAIHRLFKLMRRLHIIGLVETTVTTYTMSEDGGHHRLYDLEIRRYTPGKFKSDEDLLEDMAHKATVFWPLYDDC